MSTALAAEKISLRICPECGVEFAPHNGRQAFCAPEHKRAFHALMANRGQLIMPILLAQASGRRDGGELNNWARRQASALLDQWNRNDKEAGRRPDLVAEAKFDLKWAACDADTK